MTYTRTANGFVKSNTVPGEADIFKPIDYSDPQVIRNIMEQKERARRANEAFIAKHGRKAYDKLMSSNPEWEWMDAKIDEYGSFHNFLYEQLKNEEPIKSLERLGDTPVGYVPPKEVKEHRERPMTDREKMRHRPALGCPDCKHWVNFECTNPKPDVKICDWISERYKEKGE